MIRETAAGALRLAGVRGREFVARESDDAGLVTLPWLVLSVLAMVELAGQIPGVSGWAAASPPVVDGVSGVAARLSHAPAPLAGVVDPLRAWLQPALPAGSTWLAVAAVPVLLVSSLAVVRQFRAPTTNARALRLAAAAVGGAVMVAYVLHLAATVLSPITAGAAAVNTLLLIGVVAGSALLFRLAVGRRPVPGGRSFRWRARRTAAACAAVVAAAVALGAAPSPRFWPVAALPGTAFASHGALLADGRAYFATATTHLDVTMLDSATGERRWSRRIRPGVDKQPAAVRLSASPKVLLVDDGRVATALDAADGHPLWTRQAGTVHPFGGTVLVHDPAKKTLAAVDEMTGAERWSRRHAAQLRLFGRAVPGTPAPGASARVDAIVQVDADGTVRLLRPRDGAVLDERRQLARGAKRIWLVERTLLWTLAGRSPRLVAHSTDRLARPAWTATTGKAETATVAPCGPGRICVADASGARGLDARTGRPAWLVSGPRELAAGAGGELSVVWTGGGTALVDRKGAQVATFPDTRGHPLDSDRVLLIGGAPGERGERERTFAVYDGPSRSRRPLGRAAVDPARCTWDSNHLACAGATNRLWRLRNP